MMEDNKKAKIYGIIALIFFISCFVEFMLVVLLHLDTSSVTVLLAVYFISTFLFIIFTVLAILTYLKFRKKVAPINKAVSLLYERYAKGEITKEQLEQMKKEIEGYW